MNHLGFVLFVLAAAFVFAKTEIAIEGPDGWGAKLPTWRISNRWTKIFYGSRPLTGYHLWVTLFILLMIHMPFAMALARWSWAGELRVVAFFIFFFIIEDFLWFVMNPAYGIRRFRRGDVWWHAPTWWWIMPRDYWVFSVVGVGVYWLACRLG